RQHPDLHPRLARAPGQGLPSGPPAGLGRGWPERPRERVGMNAGGGVVAEAAGATRPAGERCISRPSASAPGPSRAAVLRPEIAGRWIRPGEALLLLALICPLTSCAKRGPPSGGPPDLEPPRVVSTFPDSG